MTPPKVVTSKPVLAGRRLDRAREGGRARRFPARPKRAVLKPPPRPEPEPEEPEA